MTGNALALAPAATFGAAFPLSWKLPERVPIVEFIEQNRFLSDRSSSSPGRYSFERYPYLREIMEKFADPEVHWLTIVAGKQTGKTESCINMLFYATAVDPMPAMWVFASEDLRKEFVNERLKPAIDASPEWKALLSPRQWAVSESMTSFTTMPLFYGLAESEASLSSKPCGIVFCDETGKFPGSTTNEGSPIEQARARQRTFPRKKFVDTSSVTSEHDGIWVTYKLSDMREWMVACPKCGERASWERADIRWAERPKGVSLLDWSHRVRMNPDMAWWQCPHCAHQVRGKLAKNQMNLGGIWIGVGYPADHPGFRIPSLMNIHSSFHEYAADLLAALHTQSCGDDSGLKNFTIQEDARPWSPKRIVVREESIAAMVRADMPSGAVPNDARILTAFIDVQDDCVYAQVWAWSIRSDKPHGHMVAHSRMTELDAAERELLKRAWKSLDGRTMRVEMTFVDSGDNALDVYRWTNKATRKHIRPSKGESVSGGGKFYRHGEGGEDSEHRGKLIKLFTEELKDYFALAMSEGRITFHAGAIEDPDFQSQMCSEERVEVKSKGRRAKRRTAWMKRSGREANHHWDCAIGALGAAVFKKMVRNDWRWRREIRRKLPWTEHAAATHGDAHNGYETGAAVDAAPKAETVPESRGTVRRVGWKPLPKRLW